MVIVDTLVVAIHASTKGVENALNKLDENLGKTEKRFSNIQNAVSTGMRNLENFLLSAGLSFLFTGMAIKNFFQNILFSIFSTFLQVEGQSSSFADTLNELKATLLFLKFTLADAFVESGLLDKWIERVETLTSFIDTLDDKTKAMFVDFSINAVVVGAAMMVIGQVLLGLIGVVKVLTTGINLLAKAMVLLWRNPLVAGAIGIALLAIIAITKIWQSELDPVVKVLGIIGTIVLGLTSIFAIFGFIAAAPFIIIIGLVVTLISLFAIFWNDIQAGAIIAGTAIKNHFLTNLNKVITDLNKIITMINKVSSVVGGPKFKTIEHFEIKGPDINKLRESVGRGDLSQQDFLTLIYFKRLEEEQQGGGGTEFSPYGSSNVVNGGGY